MSRKSRTAIGLAILMITYSVTIGINGMKIQDRHAEIKNDQIYYPLMKKYYPLMKK